MFLAAGHQVPALHALLLVVEDLSIGETDEEDLFWLCRVEV